MNLGENGKVRNVGVLITEAYHSPSAHFDLEWKDFTIRGRGTVVTSTLCTIFAISYEFIIISKKS